MTGAGSRGKESELSCPLPRRSPLSLAEILWLIVLQHYCSSSYSIHYYHKEKALRVIAADSVQCNCGVEKRDSQMERTCPHCETSTAMLIPGVLPTLAWAPQTVRASTLRPLRSGCVAMARTRVLFPGFVPLLLLSVITEEIYQERILCQRGHCIIFQLSMFEFHPCPSLSLLFSFLSLWFYDNRETTERGSSSRRFFSKTTPFEHLNLVQDYFTTFLPKSVTMCRLWFMGTQCLHTPDLSTLTAKPSAANPVTIPLSARQSK